MTHEDAGHYAAKHPEGTTPDPNIAETLKQHVRDGKITCAAAHKVARELSVSPAEVGKTIDLLEYRLSKCQLGLFGYEPEKKYVEPASTVSPELADAIRGSLVNDRLPCVSSWDLAKKSGISKMALSAACEALGIKIKPCQLGAF